MLLEVVIFIDILMFLKFQTNLLKRNYFKVLKKFKHLKNQKKYNYTRLDLIIKISQNYKRLINF